MVKIAVPFATLSAFFFLNVDISHAAQSLNGSELLDLDGNLFKGFDAADYTPDSDLSFFRKVWWYITSPDQLVFSFLADIFGLIFRILAFVGLQTPSFIFDNEITRSLVKGTSFASVVFVLFTLIYEAFCRMLSKPLNLKYTPFTKIVKRMPVVFALSAFSPFIVAFISKIVNSLALMLNSNTANLISNPVLNGFGSGFGEIVTLLLFDVSMIYLLIPIIVKNSVRWWDIFTLTLVSPFVLAKGVFGEKTTVIKDWFNQLKGLFSAQLVNSAYIALLAIILCSTNASGLPFLSKLLLIVGGMFRIANPPEFLVKANGFGNETEYGRGFWKENKLSPTNMYRANKEKKEKARTEKLELRKKLGKRSV